MTNDQESRAQALINALVAQRNDAQNLAASLAADNAVLAAKLKELETAKKADENHEPAN